MGQPSPPIIHSCVCLQGLYPLDVFLMAVVGDEKVSVCLSKTAAAVLKLWCVSPPPALAVIKAKHRERDKGSGWRSRGSRIRGVGEI